MSAMLDTFSRLRPRLHGIAYRMLSSTADAQDLVQDVWLRWSEAPHDAIVSAEAWLVTTTTRLSIDRLRAAKAHRELYTGMWIPEPVLNESPATPEQLTSFADEVSIAFLMLLERLAPEARAAFLLREVFEADYDQIALALGKSEAACRQIVHRARSQVKEARPRYVVPPETHQQLMHDFAQAMSSGDLSALNAMLAEDVELIGDGGGKITSFPKPLVGARSIAHLFFSGHRRYGEKLHVELARINGQWALLRFIDGKLESAQSYETDGKLITQIYVQRNPDKLRHIAQVWGVSTLVN